MKDTIYTDGNDNHSPFIFDDKVAEVFDDMIQRSVPGYSYTLEMIRILGKEFYQDDTICYDLGCSLGASTHALISGIDKEEVSIVAVDNSLDMIRRCKEHNTTHPASVEWICDDIQNIEVKNASVVILNFTLQFIPILEREKLLTRICEGLVPGGILILSEKILFPDIDIQKLQTSVHHAFKRAQGYSELEISGKRSALENILIPETQNDHISRLKRAGFSIVTPWFQCFNFISFLSQKS